MNQPITKITFDPSPRVTVLMPVYNAESYLAQAIESLMDQSFHDFEIIAINDGSTDRSRKLLRRYKMCDRRLRTIHHRENHGVAAALGSGLKEARGELIARMDADDLCHPERLAKQIAYLEANPGCVAVGTWADRCDPTGAPAGSEQPATDHAAIDEALLRADPMSLIPGTLMARADALRPLGGWDRQAEGVEGLDLALRLAEQGELANLPERLYTDRRHLENHVTAAGDAKPERLTRVMEAAYARRGIERRVNSRAMRQEIEDRITARANVYRDWARNALHAGQSGLARQHAIAAMRKAPWSPRSWRVLYRSFAA